MTVYPPSYSSGMSTTVYRLIGISKFLRRVASLFQDARHCLWLQRRAVAGYGHVPLPLGMVKDGVSGTRLPYQHPAITQQRPVDFFP